jgi:hypothetical protein
MRLPLPLTNFGPWSSAPGEMFKELEHSTGVSPPPLRLPSYYELLKCTAALSHSAQGSREGQVLHLILQMLLISSHNKRNYHERPHLFIMFA